MTSWNYEALDPSAFSGLIEQTGEDQTFDFTIAEFDTGSVFMFEFLAPPFEGVPGAENENLAGANLVSQIVTEEGTGWLFEELSETGLRNLGVVVQADFDEDGADEIGVTAWDPPKLEYQFPLTYGSMWNETTAQILDIEGVPATTGLTDETTYEVDGYGTLVLPVGSFPCLRLKKMIRSSVGGFVTSEITLIEFLTPIMEGSGKSSANSVAYSATISTSSAGFTDVSYSRIELSSSTTDTEDARELPHRMRLNQNYPNPFNPATTIPFEIDEPRHVRLAVYDNLGKRVALLQDGILPAGLHTAAWTPAADLPSGIYFARLTAAGQTTMRKMTLHK